MTDYDDTKRETLKETQKELSVKNETYENIHFCRKFFNLEGYDDFTEEKYPYGLVFYDFEVFEYNWLVVCIDPIKKTKIIITNDRKELREYFYNNQQKIWVGYNNVHYDAFIMKSILLNMNPKEVSDKIIVDGTSPYDICKDFNKIQMYNYDVYDGVNSLKVLEAFMGNDIEETEVDFNIDRFLTMKELQMTSKYCIHDVEQTIEVFKRRINDYNAHINIIEMFDLGIENVSKTKGQLTAMVVDCEKKEHDDEFDVKILPCIQLNKYKYVQEWFEETLKKKSYDDKLETTVCGIPHIFGWGGLHGASDKAVHIVGKMYHQDVTSFYPTLMIQWHFLTRNSKNPEKFKMVYDTRVALKKQGKKAEQAPLKIILNSQYGITKDKFSTAFDPVQANNICINGQLMLLDLIEHLETRMGDKFELIQSNTDGIIVKIAEDELSEKMMNHIVNKWCERTRMSMGKDELDEYVAMNVNSYIFHFTNGKVERKGAYVKELSELDYDLPIVNEALIKYMTENVPVEVTINECDELIKFQKIFRISKLYKYALHNHKFYTNKTFRVFASKNPNDTTLCRSKDNIEGAKIDKFANCPLHCFIWNKSVKDVSVTANLDKKWYIDLAKKRLEDFGYEFKKSNQLF